VGLGCGYSIRITTLINSPFIGAPFLVAALDGHELNEPTRLTATAISIDAAQRYDLRVRMPNAAP